MLDQPFTLAPYSHGLEDLIEKTKAYIHGAKSPVKGDIPSESAARGRRKIMAF
jgi:hypothetical protein